MCHRKQNKHIKITKRLKHLPPIHKLRIYVWYSCSAFSHATTAHAQYKWRTVVKDWEILTRVQQKCQYLKIYEQNKFHAHLSWAWKNLGAWSESVNWQALDKKGRGMKTIFFSFSIKTHEPCYWTSHCSTSQKQRICKILCICAVSPEPMLFAHRSGKPRGKFSPRIRHTVLLRGQACTLKDCFDRESKELFSHNAAHMLGTNYKCLI